MKCIAVKWRSVDCSVTPDRLFYVDNATPRMSCDRTELESIDAYSNSNRSTTLRRSPSLFSEGALLALVSPLLLSFLLLSSFFPLSSPPSAFLTLLFYSTLLFSTPPFSWPLFSSHFIQHSNGMGYLPFIKTLRNGPYTSCLVPLRVHTWYVNLLTAIHRTRFVFFVFFFYFILQCMYGTNQPHNCICSSVEIDRNM